MTPVPHAGLEERRDLMDPELLLLLDGSTASKAGFDICLTLEPVDPREKKLFVLLDLEFGESNEATMSSQHRGSVAAHIRSASVETAMNAARAWASRQGCLIAFGFLHSGSTDGLQDLLASCQESIFALSGDGLAGFMPIFEAQPHLLSPPL